MSKFLVITDKKLDPLVNDLKKRALLDRLTENEEDFFRKLKKAFLFLSENPRHPGLHSHEIDVLSKKYGIKIWESYLENHVSGARRIFWYYGPEKGEITIVGIETHPALTARGYSKINLFVSRH